MCASRFLAKETHSVQPYGLVDEKTSRSCPVPHTGQVPFKAEAQRSLLSAAAVDPFCVEQKDVCETLRISKREQTV